MEVRNKGEIKDICFRLPMNLRRELARPYGFLFVNDVELFKFLSKVPTNFYTVGDVVTSTVLRVGLLPKIALIDGKTKRVIRASKANTYGFEVTKMLNEPGLIRASAMKALKEALESSKRWLFEVEGEEDLLVIPIVLFSKDGDYVLYGQPNAGVVVLEINELSRQRVKTLFENFVPDTC